MRVFYAPQACGNYGSTMVVSNVEINEINPPATVKDAMEQEKSAASIKIAQITESEGAGQSAINRAEGEKQSNILSADNFSAVARSTIFPSVGRQKDSDEKKFESIYVKVFSSL